MHETGEQAYDCRACGACCCNPDENRRERYVDYVEVSKRSALSKHPRLLLRLTVLNEKGERHMRLRGGENVHRVPWERKICTAFCGKDVQKASQGPFPRGVVERSPLLYSQSQGHVAEWLRTGLQNRVRRFNSGRGLHPRASGASVCPPKPWRRRALSNRWKLCKAKELCYRPVA